MRIEAPPPGTTTKGVVEMRGRDYRPAIIAGLGATVVWIVTGGAVTTALLIGLGFMVVLAVLERTGEVKGPQA